MANDTAAVSGTLRQSPSQAQLVLAGSIAIDRIMNFDGLFEDVIQADKLHVLSLSVLLDEVNDTHGGVAANIAYNLALLGDSPMLLGSVGNNAKQYMNQLKELGIDTSKLHYSSKPTASFTVMTDRNDCQIGGFYPGAMADADSLTLAACFDSQERTERAVFVVSAHDPKAMARQVAEAQKLNLRLFYDVSQQVSNISSEDLVAGLSAAELLIVNDYEMGILEKKTGISTQEIIKKVPVVVVTLGERGCQIYQQQNPGKLIHVPALKDLKVKDPTGAGDAFRGGFLYGYSRDWPLDQSAQLGSVVASFAIEKHGTQEHTFTWEDVEQRLKKLV